MEREGKMNFVDPMQADKLLGGFRVVSGIKDAVVVVHAPVGCHWGVNFIERLSYGKTNATLSALRERSVIFGGDEHLKKSIEVIFKRKKKDKYLIVLAASVPSIIGDDVEGIITESSISKISYLTFDCGGYKGEMMDGYEECLAGLFPWIEEPEKKPDLPLVNIIGLQRDIPMGDSNLEEIKRMLSRLGIKINSVFPPSVVKEIKRAAKANLNIVLGYGKELAKKMEREYEIPYIFFEEYPYGLFLYERFLKKIAEHFEISKEKVFKILEKEKTKVLFSLRSIHMYLPILYDLPIVISADLAQAKGISNFLVKELGCKIKLINITSSGTGQNIDDLFDLSEKVLFQSSMHEFEKEIHDVDLIFGSEVEKVLSKKINIPIIQFSYPILSKVVLNGTPYIGFKGVLTLIEEMINKIIV